MPSDYTMNVMMYSAEKVQYDIEMKDSNVTNLPVFQEQSSAKETNAKPDNAMVSASVNKIETFFYFGVFVAQAVVWYLVIV